MKISIFGAGYVGLVTAACLAEMGNSVVCVDVDAHRVAELNQGMVPIHEPGLDLLLRRNVAARRLSFSTQVAEAVAQATLIFIAVGTPSDEDGSADVTHVLNAARSIGQAMDDYKVVVDKSTVPVGTAALVRGVIAEELDRRGMAVPFSVVSNPEFLREGSAVEDCMRPERIVIGSNDERAVLLIRSVYAPFQRQAERVLVMDERSAELTKYAANAMLATRISFMNELAALAHSVGADIEQVRLGIGSDPRIGTQFLYAGCGWGGSCLPKDVRALAKLGDDEGINLPILRAAQLINQRQRRLLAGHVVSRFGDRLNGHRVAVWGLAFKPETDDMREAPAIELVNELAERGAEVLAYDPAAGARARELWRDQPLVRVVDSAMEAVAGASALLVVTEWREFRSPDFSALREQLRHPFVVDGRNLYDPHTMAALGFEYLGIGRGAPLRPAPLTAVLALAAAG
ncbi:MAG: UDP-glucose/GDP-mannose dehydrogenase family protein [Ideonella sp.]|nr:UDP-glucose/GDP-mannose dehydrogenase family protein [Ideonella sp.]